MTKKRPLNAKLVSSPDPLFPGHIVVGVTPTASEYLAYWQALPDGKDDQTPALFASFEARKNLVREWHIEGLTESDREKAENMPSLLLIAWVNKVTGELIDEALDPKKWQGLPAAGSQEKGLVPGQ